MENIGLYLFFTYILGVDYKAYMVSEAKIIGFDFKKIHLEGEIRTNS